MVQNNTATSVPRTILAPVWKQRLRTAWRITSSVVVTLFGLLALTFFIGRLLPIDPVISIIGDQADQATYDAVFKKLGLDQPLYIQFYRYISDVARFDFGTAIFSGQLVI